MDNEQPQNKDHDPAKDAQSMMGQVTTAFNYWPWPKKPLSPFPKGSTAPGAKAAAPKLANSKPQKSAPSRPARGARRGGRVKKTDPFAGGWD